MPFFTFYKDIMLEQIANWYNKHAQRKKHTDSFQV